MERRVRSSGRESRQGKGAPAKESNKKWKDCGHGKTLHISEYGPFVVRTCPKKPLSEYKLKRARYPMMLGMSSQKISKSKISLTLEKPPMLATSSQSELDLFKLDTMIDRIWSDLVDKHARLIKAGKRPEEVVDSLKSRYIQQTQRVLLNAAGSITKPAVGRTRMSNPAYVTHRQLVEQQMEWLSTKKVAKKLYLLKELLEQKRMPQGKQDRRMLEEYGDSSQHYNGLLMVFNKEIPVDQRNHQMDTISKTFKTIMDQLDDYASRSRMQSSNGSILSKDSDGQEPQLEVKTLITLENIEATRAEWMQYFADRTRTPFEQKLSAIRLQRKEALIAEKMELKRIKMEKRKEFLDHRPLTELYNNPRLTHRMRQVLAERAEQARRQAAQSQSQSPSESVHVHPKNKPRRPRSSAKRLSISDVVLKTMEERGSCCKCQWIPRWIKIS
ncbi:GL13529 [Drosophila persimilis]|uniref:GL13529 n=1 Tax=Drosophila persimilis TaxID=7234 RepID=B4GN88_DROPE|nr:uncharacterized protein LOC6594750 [Drosophila persimilis]EDW39214.1 GL13529 [Drosophila persimilis]